jgi:hypothetical protein
MFKLQVWLIRYLVRRMDWLQRAHVEILLQYDWQQEQFASGWRLDEMGWHREEKANP